jgi:hypothetical protein
MLVSQYTGPKKDELRWVFETAGGYDKVARDLQTAVAYCLPGMQDGRELFYSVIDDVCCPKTPWTEEKGALLVLLAHFASYEGPGTTGDGIDQVAFKRIQGILTKHMEAITSELGGVEASMRASGDFDKLVVLPHL